jgi:branched-chain amino acid transport system permease protein
MKRLHLAIAVVFFIVFMGVPFVVSADYQLNVLFRIFLFAGLGLAWNLVGGYAGQLSLGHAAFFGLGAYGMSLFNLRFGIPGWPALLLGVGVAVVAAALIGTVAFRLRGPYFALGTIAFTEVLRNVAKNLQFTGGDVGLQAPALFTAEVSRSFYWSAVILTAIAFGISEYTARSRFGYYLMAIRENEDTALAVGVPTPRYKLYAYLISAALTAVGGALYSSLFLYIVPDQVLSIDISNEIAIVAMLGGAGTLLGPIVGSFILESASEIFKNLFQEAHLLIYGVLIVLVVLFLPEGIVGTAMTLLRRRHVSGVTDPRAKSDAAVGP